MDINVNEFKILTERVYAAKNQSGSPFSPDEFNIALPNAVQILFNKRYGLPEQYAPGQEPPMGWQKTQYVTDSEGTFLVVDYPLHLTNGMSALPANYVHKSSVKYPYVERECDEAGNQFDVPKFRNVQPMRNNEVASRLTDPLVGPTLKYPIYEIYGGNTIQVYPRNASMILLSYLRTPVRPVWGYEVIDDDPIYDPATSVNIEFPPQEQPMLAVIMLGMMGVNLREEELQAFGLRTEQKGT